MAETLVFPEENNECLPNFEVFNENEILETSNDLDDSEISLFIEENRNVLKYNRKDKNWQKLTSRETSGVSDQRRRLKKQGPLKKFPPRNLTIFYVICLSKSGNGTHLSQELSSTNAQLLSVRNLHRYLFQNDPWLVVIRTKMTELEVLFNFVWLDFRVLFVLSSSFFS